MDKEEFEVAMHRIAEAAPKEASPEVMSLIVANLVLLFEQQFFQNQKMVSSVKFHHLYFYLYFLHSL